MPSKRKIDLRFPLGGLVESTAIQKQPPFTTADCENVRPRDVFDGRERGGSRPGLARAFTTQLGSGANVNLLNTLRLTETTGWQALFSDDFSSSKPTQLASPWMADATLTDLPWKDSGVAITEWMKSGKTSGSVRGTAHIGALGSLNTSNDYTIRLFIPKAAITASTSSLTLRYWVYAHLDNTTPDAGDDVVLFMIELDNARGITGKMDRISGGSSAGSTAFTSGTLTNQDAIFKVTWDAGASKFSAEIEGDHTLMPATAPAGGAAAGKGIGFALDSNTVDDAQVDRIEIAMDVSTSTDEAGVRLVAGSNGNIYIQDETTTLIQDTGTGKTDTTLVSAVNPLQSVERGQKLYIADWSNTVQASGVAANVTVNGTTFTDSSVLDFSADEEVYIGDILTLTNANGAGTVVEGEYRITAVSSGSTLTLATSAGGTGGVNDDADWAIYRSPKDYDPSDSTLDVMVPTAGSIPHRCKAIALFRDSLWFANDAQAPNVWYKSRNGDPLDYDYGADSGDYNRAVAGTNADAAGRVGDDIISLMPRGDEFMVFGCRSSIYEMRGDPAAGGQIVNLSRAVGVLDVQSFTYSPEGALLFLSRNGLYMIQPGGGSVPVPVSEDQLPRRFYDLDPVNIEAHLTFDPRRRGVNIFLRPKDSGVGEHWWYDWRRRTFWPETYPEDQQAYSVTRLTSEDATKTRVLIGGGDGYIREFDDNATTDDGAAISSHVVYGPISLGGPRNEGWIDELNAALDSASGSVTWGILAADTAEAVLDATANTTGTWTAGLNLRVHPRVRGCFFGLKLSATDAWAIEGIDAILVRGGVKRLL